MNVEAISPQLLQRAQRGEPSGISALYDRYHVSVFRFLYYLTGDTHTAEDLTSEVFLRVIRSVKAYRPTKASFQAWLFRIARNLATDHYRYTRLRNHERLEENLVASGVSPDQAAERSLNSELLQKALVQLGEDQREVILMRFVLGLSLAQVAETLDKSQDAIKGLQRRGLVTLREILGDLEVHYG